VVHQNGCGVIVQSLLIMDIMIHIIIE